MRILRTILLLLYSSQVFSQSKGLELRLEIFKDTVEYLQPFEYCMHFSNNSSDSIEANAFPWENYKKPWIEVKAFGSSKWDRLYKSDVVLGMSSIVSSIYGPSNCWFDPRHSRKIPPKSHYCRQDIYYPLWKNEAQIIWKPHKKFRVRIAFFAGKKIGVIHSRPVVVYVNDTAANSGFVDGLFKNGLNTEQIFETLNYCNTVDSNAAKASTLALKYPDTYFANWITSQTLECKFTMLDRNQELKLFQKKEAASSLLHEQKALTEKLMANGFNILNLYANNIENWWWLFDIDFYEKENEWINKMREAKEPACSCQ